jgi:quinol monooxygenase YgiN
MTNNVYWLLELAIKDGELDNFKTLVKEMVEATERDEPGALNYEYWIGEDGSTCHIYERYTDSDATMVHLGNFGSKFAERFMGCVDPTGFTVYGSANAQVKEALAGFGPTYMGSFGGFSR